MLKVDKVAVGQILHQRLVHEGGWDDERSCGSWLARMLDRKPKMLVAIVLANKMARQIWAMLTRNEDIKDPALVAGA